MEGGCTGSVYCGLAGLALRSPKELAVSKLWLCKFWRSKLFPWLTQLFPAMQGLQIRIEGFAQHKPAQLVFRPGMVHESFTSLLCMCFCHAGCTLWTTMASSSSPTACASLLVSSKRKVAFGRCCCSDVDVSLWWGKTSLTVLVWFQRWPCRWLELHDPVTNM